MKKILTIGALVLAGLSLMPEKAEARHRREVVYVMVNGRPVRRTVYFEGDRPYYGEGSRRVWVREYYRSRPTLVVRDGRRVYDDRPRIQLSF